MPTNEGRPILPDNDPATLAARVAVLEAALREIADAQPRRITPDNYEDAAVIRLPAIARKALEGEQ